MVEYKNNIYFQDANGECAMEIALIAKEKGRDFQIYVLGAPRFFAGFPTIPFVAPDNPRQDLTAESIPTLQLSPSTKAGFFAIPENQMLIDEISKKYPGGERGVVLRRPNPNEILFEYYILQP
jgi:hypothetical protein